MNALQSARGQRYQQCRFVCGYPLRDATAISPLHLIRFRIKMSFLRHSSSNNAPAGPILFIRFVTLFPLNNYLSRAHLSDGDNDDEREKGNVRGGGGGVFGLSCSSKCASDKIVFTVSVRENYSWR